MTFLWITVLVLAVLAALLWWWRRRRPPVPSIPFGPLGPQRLDFDALEDRYPLTAEDRRRLTPENIRACNQEQVDQIYARLVAGPIPDGPYRGGFFFAKGGSFRKISGAIGGLPALAIDLKLTKLNRLGELLWKGKRFYRDQMVLRNIIEHEQLVARLFHVDLGSLKRDRIFGQDVALLFPARLYEGESLFDDRRPSVIIDYADNDQIEGYVESIDSLVGERGFKIRDEIRMIRPGFYLGRAYFGTLFGLNFTLYNEDVAAAES